jgi:hypothetical protein
MPDKTVPALETEKQERLQTIFERLLPMVDALADKLRLIWLLGLLVSVWLVVWCVVLKHYSWAIGLTAGSLALLPSLILLRFWWTLEELKNLPEIAGEMAGDARSQFQTSVQNLRAGKLPELSFLGAGKSLWLIGILATEARDLLGSYISFATLANPFMLILGVISFIGVFLLFLAGIVLVFFAF